MRSTSTPTPGSASNGTAPGLQTRRECGAAATRRQHLPFRSHTAARITLISGGDRSGLVGADLDRTGEDPGRDVPLLRALMTTRTELLELIRNGENSGVEFKRDTVDARGLAREIVALTNLAGGRILLGVDDDGSIVGITRPDLETWVMQACRDKVRPEVIPFFEIVRDVTPGHHVAIVEVARARLLQHRGSLRAELQPVSGTGTVSLDERRLMDYFQRVRQQTLPADKVARERLLVNTEFITEAGPATVAGILLFCTELTRYLPQAGISAAAYLGTEKDYATVERAHLRGPLTALQGAGGQVDTGPGRAGRGGRRKDHWQLLDHRGRRAAGRPPHLPAGRHP